MYRLKLSIKIGLECLNEKIVYYFSKLFRKILILSKHIVNHKRSGKLKLSLN